MRRGVRRIALIAAGVFTLTACASKQQKIEYVYVHIPQRCNPPQISRPIMTDNVLINQIKTMEYIAKLENIIKYCKGDK